MKYLITLAFSDQDSRDRCLRVLESLKNGLCGIRSIACSIRNWLKIADITTKEEK